jgi:hypothetical protein
MRELVCWFHSYPLSCYVPADPATGRELPGAATTEVIRAPVRYPRCGDVNAPQSSRVDQEPFV